MLLINKNSIFCYLIFRIYSSFIKKWIDHIVDCPSRSRSWSY